MSQLTLWFPAEVRPVHVGVYEVQGVAGLRTMFAHWSGHAWGWWAINPQTAAGKPHRDWTSGNRGQWRGLAEPAHKRTPRTSSDTSRTSSARSFPRAHSASVMSAPRGG